LGAIAKSANPGEHNMLGFENVFRAVCDPHLTRAGQARAHMRECFFR
jgi:hypothetical protein